MPPRNAQKRSDFGAANRECSGTFVENLELAPVDVAPSHGGIDVSLAPDGSNGFVSCIVTPKLTFNVLRRPEWRCVGDIPQDDLRSGFALRFPPEIGLDFEKFTFRAATPPSTELTEQTRTLVFKVVSDNLSEDRVLLSILNELERGYESKIKKVVEQQFASESLSLQSVVDDMKKAQDKQGKERQKHDRDLRDQMQTIQKRLFLLEQEKESLQKGHQDLKSQLKEARRSSEEQLKSIRDENVELRADLANFKSISRDSRRSSGEQLQSLRDDNVELRTEIANIHSKLQTVLDQRESDATLLKTLERKTAAKQSWADASCSPRGEDSGKVAVLERRVEELTTQLKSLHEWLRQGSTLFAPSS